MTRSTKSYLTEEATPFDWLIALVLGLGILPSMTALSMGIKETIPLLAKYMGPINFLKIFSPLLLYYAWSKRQRFPKLISRGLIPSLIVGTFATLLAGIPCSFPPYFLREWSVICLGAISALCFVTLPRRSVYLTLFVWGGAVYGTSLMDIVFPKGVEWLYNHVFDPGTRVEDLKELGRHVLTGVFGRQSLSKLLAWIPWLLFAFGMEEKKSMKRRLTLGLLIVISTAGTLATSQRGPFIAAIAGWMSFSAHQMIRMRNKKLALIAAAAITLSLVATALVIPRTIWETRVKAAIGLSSNDAHTQIAQENVSLRTRMIPFTLDIIGNYPFGHACIHHDQFARAGIPHENHSHNLILQQYRDRGWIWGSLHFFLWIAALVSAWRTRSESASALLAGLVAIMVSGMTDHPWFVLNHSLILMIYLCIGLRFHEKVKRNESALSFN